MHQRTQATRRSDAFCRGRGVNGTIIDHDYLSTIASSVDRDAGGISGAYETEPDFAQALESDGAALTHHFLSSTFVMPGGSIAEYNVNDSHAVPDAMNTYVEEQMPDE